MQKNLKLIALIFSVVCPLMIFAGPPGNTILGVYIGNNPNDVAPFETWLSRPAEAILGYTGAASWQDYDGSVGWAIGNWNTTASNHIILWSVPLIPSGANLTDAAAGNYNSHYLAAANQLKNFRPQDSVIYLRTAWEFNGTWFADNAVGQPDNFIAAWRQFVTTYRSVSNRFRFDWCTNFGITSMAPDLAYPGDEYVDIIGMDFYDETQWGKITDPVARWDHKMNEPYGFKWHRDFAATHHKRMSYAEWGVGGNQAGDAPYIVEQMYNWFGDNNVVYQTYWNSNTAYTGSLSNNQYPNASAKYKSLFAATSSMAKPVLLKLVTDPVIPGGALDIFDLQGKRIGDIAGMHHQANRVYIGDLNGGQSIIKIVNYSRLGGNQ